jgi:hypothetical protein
MIIGLPDMNVRSPDMIKKTPGTEKTPDTENFTPDTIIHDTLPDPVSKISPPAGRGRMVANRPCPFLTSFDVISLKRKQKKNIVVRHVFL